MDPFPSPEQQLLADTASSFVARSADTAGVRSLEACEPGYDPGHWEVMIGLGWTGLEPLELAIVAEQLGRGPLPSPLVVAGALRSALPDLAVELGPEVVLTLAVLTPGAANEWRAPTVAGGDPVSATFLLVPYAAAPGAVAIVPTAAGLVAIDAAAPGVTCTRQEVIGGDPVYRLECRAVPSRPVAGTAAVALDHLAVASLAYTVGAAEAALGLTVQHARDRHQFGRPIGAFQAVAHRCADMRAEVDACRALALRAAWALGAGREADAAVASALSYAKDALRRVAMHAHQVHGAIGFSTEHDLHLFTRRIKAFELTYGSTAWYQDRLANAIGLR